MTNLLYKYISLAGSGFTYRFNYTFVTKNNTRFYSTNGKKGRTNDTPVKKTYFQRIIKGFTISFNTPSLPDYVLHIHNHIFTRIFRVLGGMSIVFLLSGNKSYLVNDDIISPLYYVILIVGLIHFMYIIIIKIIRIYFMLFSWIDGDLEIRNSPTDRLATTAAKLFQCWKIGCEVGSASFGVIGTGFLIDQVLEAGGREKVFTPLIGKGVNLLIGGRPAVDKTDFDKVAEELRSLESSKKAIDRTAKSLDNFENTLEGSKLFSDADIQNMKKTLHELRKADADKVSRAASKIKNSIDEINRRP